MFAGALNENIVQNHLDIARRVAWSFFQVRTSTYDLET